MSIYIDAEKRKSVGKVFVKSIKFCKINYKQLILRSLKFQKLLQESKL